MLSTIAVCQLDDVAVGLGRAFDIGGKRIALFRGRSGEMYAVDGVCPHKNGPLADGMLIGSQVVCPLHATRFEGSSGACEQSDICGIESYPTAITDGMVYVTVPTETVITE